MRVLTDDDIRAIQKDANVRLCCDEAHPHSALQGCLVGDTRDIDVCRLAETLLRERAAYRRLLEQVGPATRGA